MRKLPYPPDQGLKKPVRKFEDTFSVWEVIKQKWPEIFNKEHNGPVAQSDRASDF